MRQSLDARFCRECRVLRQRKRRKKISDRTKLAALTCIFLELPHEKAKEMSENEVIALLGEWDHYPIRHADGGPDTHWNLRPLFSADHKVKTKADAKDMAKERKVRKAHTRHLAKMKDKDIDTSDIPEANEAWFKKAKRSWPSRPFQRRKT